MKHLIKISLVLGVILPVLAIGALGAAIGALVAFWPSPYERHFASPLPATAKLQHYKRSPAGFDVSYVFVFDVSDDKLLTQLVQEWSLTPTSTGAAEPTSFVALRPPPWWLNQAGLRALPERYGWFDQTNECYRSVWIDRANGKLFAEYGRW